MEQYQEVCRITRSVSNYACISVDFVHGFNSYVKSLPKTKLCNAVAISVRFGSIHETALMIFCVILMFCFSVEKLCFVIFNLVIW